MKYICQLELGCVLVQASEGYITIERTGYPYPDTEQGTIDAIMSIYKNIKDIDESFSRDVDASLGSKWNRIEFWYDNLHHICTEITRSTKEGEKVDFQKVFYDIFDINIHNDLGFWYSNGVWEICNIPYNLYYIVDRNNHYNFKASKLGVKLPFDECLGSTGILLFSKNLLSRDDFSYMHVNGQWRTDFIGGVHVMDGKSKTEIYMILARYLNNNLDEFLTRLELLLNCLAKDNISYLQIPFSNNGLPALKREFDRADKLLIFN